MKDHPDRIIVGFVGLGSMGMCMARNILKKGYPLVGLDLDQRKTEELVMMGAKKASDPYELAELSDVVITMLPGPPAVEEVVLGTRERPGAIGGMRPGKIFIDMTTNLPSESIKIAEEVRRKGGEMLDAPVVGSVKPAMEGTLTVVVGGREEVFRRARPVLEAMGNKIHYVGNSGSGCAMKLFLNSHLFGIMASFVESLALGRKAGLDTETMLKVIGDTAFKNYVSETKGTKILVGDYSPAFTVELMAKDLELAHELAKDFKMPAPIISVARDLTYMAIAQGKQQLDCCAIACAYEQLANVKLSVGKKES